MHLNAVGIAIDAARAVPQSKFPKGGVFSMGSLRHGCPTELGKALVPDNFCSLLVGHTNIPGRPKSAVVDTNLKAYTRSLGACVEDMLKLARVIVRAFFGKI